VLGSASEYARYHGVEARAKMRQAAGPRLSRAIVDEARQFGADLVVLGSPGRGGLARRLLGGVAERVTRSAPIPVLLVRAA